MPPAVSNISSPTRPDRSAKRSHPPWKGVRRMSNRLVSILLILSLAFNLAVAASLGWLWATRDGDHENEIAPHEMHDPCGPACRVLSRRMGLSGERAERVHRIMGESADRTRELRIEIGEKRRRLAYLLTGDAADS
ncbi:MAG TPA: periplasmic heavy metal sensor, partial [Alphaproteobacteria bacterium]|nr:periplasmic heavy metal sensor [Alphaproteobacteria bacterium]